ncbi:hypothetical protein EsDP_00004421 [Epichloe bromicola]|uniref:Phospholipase/carboxylesterase/thioesterase domain-containing protein n=1 Tax=Epichloe bromicola TaxID=79588 RepID=A0ABQ0CRQ3_9HYPO
MESTHAPRTPAGQFPQPIIIPPLQEPHQHTIILLHGRGSNARKFHRPLLDTALDGHQTFREAFPTARFVFPTAPMSRATKYARMLIHQWFDGAGDWEPEARGGMRPSIEYIQRLVRSEIRLLGGDARHVVLAGLSQGCATALTSLLLWDGQSLGAMVGLCGYVPACSHLIRTYDEGPPEDEDDDVFEREEGQAPRSPLMRVLEELRDEAELENVAGSWQFGVSSTPVFLGHGTSDPKVDISQAFLADELLRRMGMSVELRTYEGLGHWYSREMLCHVVTFLRKHLAPRSALGNLV